MYGSCQGLYVCLFVSPQPEASHYSRQSGGLANYLLLRRRAAKICQLALTGDFDQTGRNTHV